MPHIGEPALDFAAVDCNGRTVRLQELRGRRVVLFFFPKSFSIACTLEVRAFRDNHARIQALGAELIGVSVDRPATQCEFAAREGVRFTLIGDESRDISRAYGVLWPILNVDRRVTFFIDEEGIVRDIIRHEVRVGRHLDDVLALLGEASAAESPNTPKLPSPSGSNLPSPPGRGTG
ncbi:MAG: peroxiredoxin family protein [Myxococcaceae bacterium]|nr:peroxiredoxin family protein [Myxococcaceae bacterium]